MADVWQAINDSADAYLRAAYRNSIVAPNPQIFVDSATAGAVPSVVDAFGSQDPAMDSLLAARPSGTIPRPNTAPAATTPDLSSANVTGLTPPRPFDEKAFLKQQNQDIQTDSNGAGKWKGLGEVPVANGDYLKGLVNTTDKGRITKYQNYLVSIGLGDDANGHPMKPSGAWDGNWLDNLQNFMIIRFLPEAMWGKNSQTQKAAKDTLFNYLNVDTTKLPKMDDNALAGLINQWVHTNGDSPKPKNSLQDLADKYGDTVLDKAHQSMLHPGFFSQALNFWGGAMSAMNPLSAIGAVVGLIPGVPGSAKDSATIAGNPVAALGKLATNAAILSPQDLKSFDKNTAAMLQDMSATANQQSGVFGALDAYDKLRGQALITAKYMGGDAIGAITGKGTVPNPFDSWQRASIHTDDVFHELFGNNFITDAPVLSAVGAFGLNVVDDPLTYAGGVGIDYKINRAALAAGDMENAIIKGRGVAGTGISLRSGPSRTFLWTNPTIRDGIKASGEGKLGLVADTLLRPHLRAKQEMLKQLVDPARTTDELRYMLGASTNESIAALVEAKASKDPVKLAQYLEEFHAHKLLNPSTMHMMNEAEKIYHPKNWNGIDSGRQAHILDYGIRSETHIDDVFNINDLAKSADAVRIATKVFGFDAKETQSLYDILYDLKKDPTHRAGDLTQAIQGLFDKHVRDGEFKSQKALDDAIEEARGYTKLSFMGKVRFSAPLGSRRNIGPNEDRRLYLPVDNGAGGVDEASKIIKQWTYEDPGVQAEADSIRKTLAVVPHQIDTYRTAMVEELQRQHPEITDENQIHALLDTHPQYNEEIALLQEKAKDMVDYLRNLPGRKGFEGEFPAAAFSTQFEGIVRLPVRPFDLLVARSPVLRKAEWFQAASHMNDLNALWKKSILARVSTAIRVNFGDETSRTVIYLMNRHPLAALKFLKMKATRDRGGRDLPEALRSDLSRLVDFSQEDYIPFKPSDSGYVGNSWNFINGTVASAPETKVWANAMKAGGDKQAVDETETWLKSGDPNANEYLRRENVDPTNVAEVRSVARAINTKMKIATRYDPAIPFRQTIFKHVLDKANGTGGMTKSDWNKFVAQHSSDAGVLPLVVGRRPYAASAGVMSRTLNAGSEFIHHRVIGTMVNNTRKTAFNVIADERKKIIQKYYGTTKTPEQIEEMAAEEAHNIVQRTTYQFHRTMIGQSVRNIFPFWGATASMSRFWLREAVENPMFGRGAAEFLKEIDKKQNSGSPIRMTVPGTGWLMGHLGMNNADNISFDPTHLAFFAADGYGGFIPSMGPMVMTPLKMEANNNPDLMAALKQLPGGQYLGYDTPLFPYLERIVSGSQMLTGHDPTGIPLIGGAEKALYDKSLARETEAMDSEYLAGRGPKPTEGDVKKRVGAETLLRGVAQGVVPFNVQAGDPKQEALVQAEKDLNNAKTDADKIKVLTANHDIAPILLYRQRELVQIINPADFGLPAGIKDLHPSEIRDAISATFPEVEAYVSTVESPGGLTTPYLEPTAFRFNEDLKTGRIKYLSTPEILDKVDKSINVRDGYLEYNRADNLYKQSLIYYGVTSASATGKALKKAIVDPVLTSLNSTNQDWAAHFAQITSNTAEGLKLKSADIMTLASWEVLPHFDDPTVSTPEALKTQNSWRQLLSDRSELSAYLRQITAQGATAQDKQQVIELFRERVDMIAANDPGFANMIKNFSISNMDEFLKVGAA